MSLLMFAQGEGAKGPGEIPFYMNPLFLMAMVVLFFFVVMWPAQRRQRKEQENMLANIKSGSKVVLSSGVVGTVTRLHDDGELTIRSDESKLRVLRSAVISVRGEEAGESK
jgi:preprotein translocase subunit YajC